MASKEIRGLFMTAADEADFSTRLRAAVERVTILDGKGGPDERPLEIASISDASGVQVWLFERRDDVPLQWTSLPPLVQFVRCRTRQRDDRRELSVGRMAIQYDDRSVDEFLACVWRVFRGMCTNKLAAYYRWSRDAAKPVRDMWLAPDAQKWHDDGGWLASNAADLYYTTQ